MYATWATICKELLQLQRDKAGLALLFLMPAFLVLIISLVQDNVLNNTGRDVKAVFINHDNSEVGDKIEKWLSKKGGFQLVKHFNGQPADRKRALKEVNDGRYQFCVIIPENCTEAMRARSEALAEQSLSADKKAVPKNMEGTVSSLTLFFDPTIQGSFRTTIISSIEQMMLALEVQEKSRAFSKRFPSKMKEIIKTKVLAEIGEDLPPQEQDAMIGDIPEIKFHWSEQPMLALDQETLPAPTAVQQNVPAWALFGMFFIVVPLGGSLLRERDEGTLTRLLSMPISYFSLLLGKIIAYVSVCMVQFVLMLLVGIFILPLFGTPVLELGNSPGALVLMTVSSALAATGFGILIGTVTRSYEQATMFGPVSVVIMAAIGGIMVPVYLMPRAMKQLSICSPMAWGLNGFLDIFVRGAGILQILPWAAQLLAFFAVCLGTAWVLFRRRKA